MLRTKNPKSSHTIYDGNMMDASSQQSINESIDRSITFICIRPTVHT